MRNYESGNVIFYILIAVALLAGLSFAVSQSGRGGVAFLTDEQAKMHATEIIQYSNTLKQAVTQIKLRGYGDDEISFENTVVNGYANANCTDDECEIFHVDGGGLTFLGPPAGANDGSDWLFAANAVKGVVTNVSDLTMILQNIDQAICQQLNLKLHGTDAIPQAGGAIGVVRFNGTYGAGGIEDPGAITGGKTSYCMEGNSTPAAGTYFYYAVLIAR